MSNFFSPFQRNANERRQQSLTIQNGRELVEDINSAKYYMSMGIYEWSGPLALSNLSPTRGLENAPIVLSAPISVFSSYLDAYFSSVLGAGLLGYSSDASLTQIIKYKLPISERLSDTQSPKWPEATLGGGTFGAIAGALNSVSAGLSSGIVGDALTLASITTGLSINEFKAIKFEGPSFKTYTFTWTLSPNTPEIARNIKDFLRTVNKFVAPKKISLLWDYPKIFKLELNRNNTENPNMYKFKPAVCTNINVNYGGSDIPTFLPDGHPETVRITMTFKELVYWSREDYNENW